MVLNKEYIIEEILNNDIKVTGSLHIGAHECEEISIYYNLGLELEDMLWIEANPDKVKEAKQRNIPNVYEAVITNEDNKKIEFHVANNFQSSSVLELGTHIKDHPDIKYVSSFMAKTITIKTFFKKHKILNPEKYNFWNFDIQGAELMALQGAEDLIKNVKVINIEVNTKQVYKGCPLMSDIDNYLGKYGFKRILTKITPQGWGDALYIIPKKQIYIYNNNSFGDKIFNLIYGIYLYNLYKGQCKINYVIDNSKYTKEDETYLDIIFPDSKTKINFIKYDQLSTYNKSLINKILSTNSHTYNTLREFPKYEYLKDINHFNDCFQLTYKMYETFEKSDIDIFQNINKSLITDEKVLLYQNLDYAILDIRYDNKLICNIDKNYKIKVQDDKFILYTPQYYTDMMRLLDYNIDIIIITDSKELVIEYILRTYYHKNRFIFIDANYINSFFLFYNAKKIVMSNTTFSIAGAYFNMSNVNNVTTNINTKNIYYLLYRDKNSKHSLPEEKAIPDTWNIESYKKYILNYDILLITDMCKFIIDIKKIKNKQKLIIVKGNLSHTLNLPIKYKNQIQINYNMFIYKLKINTKVKSLMKNPYKHPNSIDKFNDEIYFDKLLTENNIKSTIFITKNIWSSFFKRLFDFSTVKTYTLYINEHDNNDYDMHKPLSFYINKEIQKYESLIVFLLKGDFGVEFDFIYDYYMFKINEYLNTVKNMKLLIICYYPNLILPFTFNTLINISNHSENYKIVTLNNNIYIIFNNIKNYNIDVLHLKSNFINMYNNMYIITNEDILEDIFHSQIYNNSIGNTYYYNFNNTRDLEKKNKLENNYEYKINIINYPIKVNNEKFTTDLLINIYKFYDNFHYFMNLFTIKNIENKILFENYYYKLYNNWNKLLYDDIIEKKSIKLSIKNRKTLKNIKKTLKSIKKTFNITTLPKS